MLYNYGCTFNIKTIVPLFQIEINGLTHSGHYFSPKSKEKLKERKWQILTRNLRLGVIKFGLVWFLSKKNNQTEIVFLKKKKLKLNRNRFEPVGFGLVF